MDAKQKKIFTICAAVVVGSYAFKSVGQAITGMAVRHQQAEMAEQQSAMRQTRGKAAETKKAETPPPPPPPVQEAVTPKPPDPPVDLVFPPLRGRYIGGAALVGRGICGLRFDMRDKPGEPGTYLAAFSLTCNPNSPVNGRKRNAATDLLSRMDPEAATLSGVPENGILKLDTETVIGKSVEGCAVSSVTITPFGVSRADVAWTEETPCKGGHIILRKIG